MTREEKRDTSRAKRRVMCRFGVDKPDKTGFTMNLSQTGVFVKTNSVFAPGTTLRIEMAFPDRSFSMWGLVARAKKVPPNLAHVLECGMGIRFIDPPVDWLEFFEVWSKKH